MPSSNPHHLLNGVSCAITVTEPNRKPGFLSETVENRNRGFLEPRKQFLSRQFRAGRLENAAYMRWVAHSIQGLNMQTISDTPTCMLSKV